jgi:hypothetical protein
VAFVVLWIPDLVTLEEAGDCLPLDFCEVLKSLFFSGNVGDG